MEAFEERKEIAVDTISALVVLVVVVAIELYDATQRKPGFEDRYRDWLESNGWRRH